MYGESRRAAIGRAVGRRGAAGRTRWSLIAVALTFVAMPLTAWGQACPMRCVVGDPEGVEAYDEGKLCTTDADCNVCNTSSADYDEEFCNVWLNNGGVCQTIDPCVHLEFRPLTLGASGPGQIVNLGLYAVSGTGFDVEFEAMSALLEWDPSVIRLVGSDQPCDVTDPCNQQCPANTYKWFSATFPNDCDDDGINAPCPGDPANDGSALFIALSQLQCGTGEPAAPPVATPAGLHVTTFQFEVLSDVGTSSDISIPFTFGGTTRTRVSGVVQAADLGTGVVGPPALVSVEECVPPTLIAHGSKVIEVQPATNAADTGIVVTSDSPGVECMTSYASADGELQQTPLYQSSAAWGSTVRLRGRRIMPSSTYFVQSACGSAGAPNLSASFEVTMALWADTDASNIADFVDIERVVAGFLGNFGPDLKMVDVDLVGRTDPNPALSRLVYCIPNDIIDFLDIAAAVDAFLDPSNSYANACDVEFCN